MSKQVFTNFRLIDGNGHTPLEKAFLIVEDKRIAKIGDMAEFKSEETMEVMDLQGKTIMPGIINSHVHITMEPVGDPVSIMGRESSSKTALRGVANLKKHLYAGTTYFRDLGAKDGIDIDLRDAIKEGLIEGPEFLAGGKCITMTGGHGWFIGREADGVDEITKATREQLKAGVDVVKIMATGGVMTKGVEPGSPQLSMKEMEAAVIEAHKAGRKTATHAQGTEGIKNAILAGIDSVEHGIFLDEEAIQMMLDRGVYLVPTLVAPYFIIEAGVAGGVPKQAVEKSEYVMKFHQDSFTRAYKAGVKIAMGTDSGTPYNLHDKAPFELKLMVECGMTPMDSIVASTKSSADLLGILDNYGTLEEGKFADFLILDDNPIHNLDTLFDLNSVYKLGRKVK